MHAFAIIHLIQMRLTLHVHHLHASAIFSASECKKVLFNHLVDDQEKAVSIVETHFNIFLCVCIC